MHSARSKISAFVVCFNEEDHIEDCLRSLDFCDEIVVIDSYSTDGTVKLCEQYGAKVIQRPWPGYKEQKAFGLSATQNEWVLNLDADERVSPQLRESILDVLKADFEDKQASRKTVANGYEMNRVVYYLGRWWRRGGWYPEYRVRFFRRENVVWGGVDPHEKPIVSGQISRLKGELYHYTYRCMDEQFRRLHQHASIAAVEDHRRGKKFSLSHLILNPISRVLKFYVFKLGFLEGKAGLIVALTEGYYTFMKYARLWEIENYGEPSGKTKNG